MKAKSTNLTNTNLASWALRLGLIFVFLYAGISSLHQPLDWTGYLPHFLTKIMIATTWVKLFAAGELILAAWLLLGRYLRYAAWLSAILLASIVITNLNQLIITFRDVGLCLMAVALALLSE